MITVSVNSPSKPVAAYYELMGGSNSMASSSAFTIPIAESSRRSSKSWLTSPTGLAPIC